MELGKTNPGSSEESRLSKIDAFLSDTFELGMNDKPSRKFVKECVYKARTQTLEYLVKKLLIDDLKAGLGERELQVAYDLAHPKKEPKPERRKWLITLSFKPNTTPTDVHNDILSYSMRVNTNLLMLAHEQRGEIIEDCGKGYHIHMVDSKAYKTSKSDVIREAYSTFKKWMDNKTFVDARVIHTDNGVEDYLNGIKQDPSKKSKVEIDKEFLLRYPLRWIQHTPERLHVEEILEHVNPLGVGANEVEHGDSESER